MKTKHGSITSGNPTNKNTHNKKSSWCSSHSFLHLYILAEERFQHPVVLLNFCNHADENICRAVITSILRRFFTFIKLFDHSGVILDQLLYHIVGICIIVRFFYTGLLDGIGLSADRFTTDGEQSFCQFIDISACCSVELFEFLMQGKEIGSFYI